MQQIADNLWVLRFPLSLLGARMGRTVTVMRLTTGEVIVHSTAPFAEADVGAIADLGQPAWLVEATLFHDTFAKRGREAFPAVPYLAPEGFSAKAGVTGTLVPEPAAWKDEVAVLELKGMPAVREHVFLHRPTRTLIVADLVFNFGPQSPAWTRRVFRYAAGIRQFPGMGRLFCASIRDRAAFAGSVRQIMAWDFDRLVPGHGDIIESGAKQKLAAALAVRGY